MRQLLAKRISTTVVTIVCVVAGALFSPVAADAQQARAPRLRGELLGVGTPNPEHEPVTAGRQSLARGSLRVPGGALSRAAIAIAAADAAQLDLIAASAPASTRRTQLPADQQRFSPWFVRGGFQAGWVIPTSDFVRGENLAMEPINGLWSFRAELGYQTDGSRGWHDIYKYPSYGIGVFHADYGNAEELGNPWAVYGFFSWPIFVFDNGIDITTDFGLGGAFGWQGFDPETNPFNRAIGGSESVYIDWGFFVKWPFANKWDLSAGYSFTHYSNGRTTYPNLGFNTIAPMALVRYNVWQERPARLRQIRPAPPYARNWQVAVRGFLSQKQVEVPTDDPDLQDMDRRRDFGVGGASATVNYQVWHTSKLAFGVDYSRDNAADAELENVDGEAEVVEGDSSAKNLLGIFGGYEHVISRFSIVVDVGYYAVYNREDGDVPRLYQRIGFKYHLYDGLFGGMNIRIKNWGQADYIEWNLGYRFEMFGG